MQVLLLAGRVGVVGQLTLAECSHFTLHYPPPPPPQAYPRLLQHNSNTPGECYNIQDTKAINRVGVTSTIIIIILSSRGRGGSHDASTPAVMSTQGMGGGSRLAHCCRYYLCTCVPTTLGGGGGV